MALLTRIILASTDENDWILDPFAGSSTTGIAANLCGRRFLGIEQEAKFSELSRERRKEIDDSMIHAEYIKHLSDLSYVDPTTYTNEPEEYYGIDLPF